MTEKNVKKTVHALRGWRAGQGLTQEELAHKIGYASPSIIQGIESWRLEPKIGEVKKLCDLSRDILQPWDFLEPVEADNAL